MTTFIVIIIVIVVIAVLAGVSSLLVTAKYLLA